MGTNLKLSGRRADGTEFPVDIRLSFIGHGDDLVLIAAVRDMTDHEKAAQEHDLTEQRESFEDSQRMAAMVENSNDAIISTSPEGIVTSWNPAAEWLYGCSSEEIIGKSVSLFVPGDRTGELKDILAAIKAGRHVRHLETMRVRKDGTTFPVSLTVSPIRDPAGAVVGAVTIARDVTEQREALAVAQRSAAIIEYSADSILSKTLDGIITSWNPASTRLYGYSGEEIIGKPTTVLSPREQMAESRAILARIRAGGHVENFETLRVRKDGRVFPASITVSPIRDAEGTVIGASTIAHDLTAQKEASELARSMIEASPDSMVSISPDGKITDVNEATVTLTGVPRDKLIGTTFCDYFTEPGKAEEIYQQAFSEGMAMDCPLTLRRRDGGESYTEVLYNASVYRDAGGKVIGVFAAARDLTAQREAAQYARSLIEAALDPLLMISPEGQITDVNQAAVRATGIPRDQLIGTSFSDYFTEPGKAEEIYQKVFEQGSVTDYPLTLRRRDKPEAHIEVLYNASVYLDSHGKVGGVLAAARDVTRQVQAQREIARQQAKELERLAELERFQRLTVGRELKMIGLKKEIEYLRKSIQADEGEPDGKH
jgi:PAS domain S-box-containing protein